MRCALAVFLIFSSTHAAFALDFDCNKIIDRKNPIQVEMENTQKSFFDKGNVKEEKQQQTIRISRGDDGSSSSYSHDADGKRRSTAHSRYGRPHHLGIVTEKGEMKIKFTYYDDNKSFQMAGRRDFEVRQLSETYQSEEDKEGRREGNLMQYKFAGDRVVSIGNCTYKTVEYEFRTYKFNGKDMASLSTGIIQYAPSIPLLISQTTNLYDRETLIRSFENRVKSIAADKR